MHAQDHFLCHHFLHLRKLSNPFIITGYYLKGIEERFPVPIAENNWREHMTLSYGKKLLMESRKYKGTSRMQQS